MDQFAWNKDVPVLYKQNTTNDLFYLRYIFEMGNNNDKKLGTAAQYLRFLGTSDMTLEQLNSKFYGLACSFNVSPGDDRTYITLSGLNENLPQAIELFEKILADAQTRQDGLRQYGEEHPEVTHGCQIKPNAKLHTPADIRCLW